MAICSNSSTAAFHDGWFRTGDLGYLDSDGYLFVGRLKEMINRGGEKIIPREIDEALLAHPAVALAVAFPYPHPTLGEDVAAVIVVRPGTEVSSAELTEFVATKLPAYKVPRRVIIAERIPVGPTGKLQRCRMAEQLGLVGHVQDDQPEGPPSALEPEQLHRVVAHGQGPEPASPASSVVELVIDQARRTPEAPAVIAASGVLSYQQLEERTLQIASALASFGIGDGDVVGIAPRRDHTMVADSCWESCGQVLLISRSIRPIRLIGSRPWPTPSPCASFSTPAKLHRGTRPRLR